MNQTPHIKITILLLLFISMPLSSFAQYKSYLIGKGESKLNKLEEAADYAFKNRDYYAAYRFYKDALGIDSTKLVNRYGLAQAAEEYGAFCVASEAYDRVEAAVDTMEQSPFPNIRIKAGEMKKLSGAIDQADIILKDLNAEETDEAELNRHLADIRFIENAWNEDSNNDQPSEENLGRIINTDFAEFSPVWRKETLYYGSLAYQKKKDKVRPRRMFSKVLRTKLDGQTEEWDLMNIADKSVGHLSFTSTDDRVYFTICDYTDQSLNLVCQLYYKDKTGIGKDDWGVANPLPPAINNPNFTNTQPSVGLNEKGEKVLYFVSNRPTPESMGGMDIWYTKIYDDNTFSSPVNLGEQINTSRNEITPFYHDSTKTLYFSSDGYQGFGGYDINKTTVSKEQIWGEVENLKEPFNSSHHDYNFFLKTEGREAFFVSGREGCEIEQSCHDIYKIDIPCRTRVLASIYDEETGLPILGASVEVLDTDIIGTPIKEGSNEFLLNDITMKGLVNLKVRHLEYPDKTAVINVKECEENNIIINLPCQPKLNVKVFSKTSDGKGGIIVTSIEDAMLTLSSIETTDIAPKNQKSNSFDYELQRDKNYKIEASHPSYESKNIEIIADSCSKERVLYLELIELNPEFDTIACYFHHDIPKRAAGVPDTICKLAYNEFYEDYRKLNSKYQGRFMAREVGDNREKNRKEVVKFFKEKVDESFSVLERFKDDLLKKLESLPDQEIYIIYLKGYTSNVGENDYNDKLAKRRISSVKNYFLKTHKVAFEKYLYEKKSLIFEDLALGEVGPGFDNPTDYKNTIYNPVSAEKRRVEIIRKRTKRDALFNPEMEE